MCGKASPFRPMDPFDLRLCLRVGVRGVASRNSKSKFHRRAQPFRTSGGKAAIKILRRSCHQMKAFLLLLLGLFLLIVPLRTRAQLREDKTATTATPRLEELRAKGSEALFNLDYEGARQAFKEIARLIPH